VRIGVPAERTPGESRVALAPHAGHRVLVEAGVTHFCVLPLHSEAR
jgi:alanine dehydrogenase